ncbi:response regulator transcription factor [Cohnella thermotolerans]|jgi:two-component system response regulator YesN|uniref:response regulator transcription factor n=1 Tax=Cohnella thermotolerans TaxID=329858 RepID=UPI0003F54206|nr:response regulator [Cohnella thermotolerans]
MLKLMLVDDEPAILTGLKYMIGQEKTLFTDVVCASDGIEALEMLDSHKPDLMITDIQMPEMNGLELIREAQRKRDMRFVVLTGYDTFEYARQSIRLQVADYLLKPIDRKELSALLRKTALDIVGDKGRGGSAGRTAEADAAGTAADSEQAHHAAIRKFKAFIQDNYMTDLSLEQVAEHLGLHPNYVCGVLKRETDMTFVQYLRQVRLEKAKELLRSQPAMPLEQVAVSVGYLNPRHFYKVFKKVVGQTPGSFRGGENGLANTVSSGQKPAAPLAAPNKTAKPSC